MADFGFEVGGPIIKDRLWFYAGFAPRLTRTTYERYQQSTHHPDRTRPTPATALRDGDGFATATVIAGLASRRSPTRSTSTR